jgi:hypothetical protein
MNTALEYSTRVVQEGGRRCKKSTLNDLVHLTPLRIPLMNPPIVFLSSFKGISGLCKLEYSVHRGIFLHSHSVTITPQYPTSFHQLIHTQRHIMKTVGSLSLKIPLPCSLQLECISLVYHHPWFTSLSSTGSMTTSGMAPP